MRITIRNEKPKSRRVVFRDRHYNTQPRDRVGRWTDSAGENSPEENPGTKVRTDPSSTPALPARGVTGIADLLDDMQDSSSDDELEDVAREEVENALPDASGDAISATVAEIMDLFNQIRDKTKPEAREIYRAYLDERGLRATTKSIYEVEGSFDWLRSKLDRELRMQRVIPTESEFGYIWLKDIFNDRIIVEDEDNQKLYEVTWEMDSASLQVTFGVPEEVRAAYVTKSRKDAKFGDIPLESPIITRNKAKKIATGAVLVPGEPDYYGDVLTAEKIEEVANEFMLKYRYNDLQHTFGEPVASPVQSYTTLSDMDVTFPSGEEATLPKGTWIMSVKVVDEHWDDVESGKIRGFSIAGVSREQLEMLTKSKKPIDIELEDITIVPSANDLGSDDWGVPAVSLVDNPAVGKALFFALKNKQPEKDDRKPSILERIFGKKSDEKPEVVAASKTTHEESDSEMAENKEEKSVEMSELVAAVTKAMSAANEDLLKKAGIIKAEPTQEELLAAAVAEAMKPLQEEIRKLKANDPKAESAEDEDDEDEGLETAEAEEDLVATVKSMRKRIKALERGVSSSRSLSSDEDDDDDDVEFDGEDDGRDLFGRRTEELK